jgi:nucleotide-binding universal stress UspA family protein
MYRRILMPTDGSLCSGAALGHGSTLARDQDAEVKIIYVLDTQLVLPFDEGVNVVEIQGAWHRRGQTIVNQAVKRAGEAGARLAAAELVETGGSRISDAVVGESKRWQADLIVMGTHGRHGVEHLLLGSVAEGVVRTASIPVLLLRAG